MTSVNLTLDSSSLLGLHWDYCYQNVAMHNPEFWLKKNDRVFLIKESELVGTVTHIDENLIETHGVTTCNVLWDGDTEADIQWTNKLALVEKAA